MRSSKRVGGLMLALVSAAAAACAGDPSGVKVPAEAVALQAEDVISVETAWSGFQDPVRTVITDSGAWAEAWRTLYRHQTPAPELPQVDFRTHVIVLAAMGTRPSTGYSVRIESVHHHDGLLYVSVLERSPGPSCGVGAAITAPVHAVQVAREGTTARFSVRSETFSC